MNYQTKVKNQYEKEGYLVLNIIRLSDSGYPDLMCLKNGKVLFIECKTGNDTLKPLQKHRIDILRQKGFEAICLKDGNVIY